MRLTGKYTFQTLGEETWFDSFFILSSVGVVLSLLFVEFVLEDEMKSSSLFYMQFVHMTL